jgi:hypothetical protein
MTRKLVFWTAFNSYQSERTMRQCQPNDPHPVTTLAWTERRIEFFRKFNMPSIMGQVHDDFLYMVIMDPSLRAMTERLMPKVDDRIVYVYDDAEGLAILQRYDEIVYTLIDSDDMYSRHAGEILMWPGNKEWMTFRYGYAFDYLRGRLFHYDTIFNGPFFAHRLDPKTMKFFDREKRHPGHKSVAAYHPQEMPAGHFCVLLHDRNTSSHPGMKHVSKIRADNKILNEEFSL